MPWDDVEAAALLMGYYLVACLALPTLLRITLKISEEVMRKLQHIAYSCSIFLLLTLFTTWYFAVAGAFLLVVAAYPALLAIEGTRQFRRLFVVRPGEKGELRRQLLLVQLSFAILVLLFWGVLGQEWRYLAVVPVMGWGFGDAAAALVGKAVGRTQIDLPRVDRNKTLEGTLAMIGAAGVALFLALYLYVGAQWQTSLAIAAVVAPICGLVELYSRRGTDTLTVPLAAAAGVIPLFFALSAMGW